MRAHSNIVSDELEKGRECLRGLLYVYIGYTSEVPGVSDKVSHVDISTI